MRLRLLAGVLCLAVLPVMTVGSPAAAAAPPVNGEAIAAASATVAAPAVPASVTAKLTAAQRNLLPTRFAVTTGHSVPHRVGAAGTVSPAATRVGATSWCGSYWYTIYSYAGSGMIWWYRMTFPWCWTTGVRIFDIETPFVTIHITPIASVAWEFGGVESISTWKLDPTPTAAAAQSQGQFKFCPVHIGCLYSVYPYLRLKVNDLGQGFKLASGGN